MLGRTFAEWKVLGAGLLLLTCGVVIGDAYRSSRSDAVEGILLRVSEASDLERTSLLLMLMKRNQLSCARSLVQVSVEQGIVRARALQNESRLSFGFMDDLNKSVMRAKQALELKDRSGVDVTEGCNRAQR